MHRHRSSEHGLTFAELLIASALAAVAGTVLVGVLINQMDFLELTAAQGDVRSRIQLAIDAMIKELRHATHAAAGSPPNVSIPAAPNNTTMTFFVPTDQNSDGLIIDPVLGTLEWDTVNPIHYQYDAATRQLRRVAGGATRVIAHHVSSVAFEDQAINASLNGDEVKIRLTLDAVTPQQRTISTTASAIVKLRN